MLTRNDHGVLSIEIISNGSMISDEFRIIRMHIEKQVNRISTAKIEILDGDAAKQDFILSNKSEFEPGAMIEIKAGYNSKVETIFKGIVVRMGARADAETESRLVIECRDIAIRMTVGRKSENFIDKSDSDIISTLISSHTGLDKKVTSTKTIYKEQVQYYCTDWDFLLMRAEANAFVVLVDDGKIEVLTPKLGEGKSLDLQYGVDLISFELDASAEAQLNSVKTRSWNPKTQEVDEQVTPPKKVNALGDLGASELADVVGLDEYQLQSSTTMEADELKTWGAAQQIKADFARVSGSIKVRGNASAKPGEAIDLTGVGKRFSGKSYISGVVHLLEDSGWTTDIEVGMEDTWLAQRASVSYPAASGLVASVPGLQIAKVLKLDEDPAGEHRIQVTLPSNKADKPGIWARFSSFYASNNGESCGAFFVPEVGDEVVLGFLDGHPSHPVILGSLYSSKHNPYQELTAENHIKGLVSRSQLKIEFDDEKKIITVVTPENNSIVINDEEKSIVLEDQTGNKVLMSEEGISLKSPKNITLEADGKIELKASNELSIKSSADVSVSGKNIKNVAKMGFSASGSSQASLESSGQTVVKGSMVMIN